MGRHSHRSRDGMATLYAAENPELAAEQWIKSAEDDLAVAQTLLFSGHYNWAAFACQQAIEKTLKAGYAHSRHKIPPHVHKLDRLTSIMRLNPPEAYLDHLLEIDQCYTSTRYPGYKSQGCARSREETQEILEKTWEIYRWLKRELRL